MKTVWGAIFLNLTAALVGRDGYAIPAAATGSIAAQVQASTSGTSGSTAPISTVPSTISTPVVMDQPPPLVPVPQINGTLAAPAPISGAAPQRFDFVAAVPGSESMPVDNPMADPENPFCAYQDRLESPKWWSQRSAMSCAAGLHPCAKMTHRFWKFLLNKKNRKLAQASVSNAQSYGAFKARLFAFLGSHPEFADEQAACFQDKDSFIQKYCMAPRDTKYTHPEAYCRNDMFQMACGLFFNISTASIQAAITACAKTPGRPLESRTSGMLTKGRRTAEDIIMRYFGINIDGELGLKADFNKPGTGFTTQAQQEQQVQ